MAEYIERTKELVLAMNAGARVIENTRRYHGTVYSKDVFSETPQKIPYLQAAKVLREVSDAPDADVAPVVRCKDCRSYNKPKRDGVKSISTVNIRTIFAATARERTAGGPVVENFRLCEVVT